MRKSQFAVAAALLALLGLLSQVFGQKSSETGAPVSDRDKLEERLSADMQIGYEYDSQGRPSDTYNERHIATGAELRNSQGGLLGHSVRTFDANGLVIAEQQIADAPDLMIPEELRTNPNPDQMKAVGAFMAGGMMNRSVSYSYDATGRVIDWGIDSKRRGSTCSTAVSEAPYAYRHDSYGNGTEQAMMYRSSAKDWFTPGVKHRRKLTYY